MENRIIEQFKGFLSTHPLWAGSGPLNIEQFQLPTFHESIPSEDEILIKIPSLSRNFVLGKRMESFFSFVIQNTPEYHLIAENLQISRNKITIGEIDFIINEEKTGGLFHVELVYKFYVYDPSFTVEEERWIGPNRRDSLLRKIKKLKEHQFPLIYREETQLALTTLEIDHRSLEQQVCFKANLFIPREMKGKYLPLINNVCICGYWIKICEFSPTDYSGSLFFAPKKPDWPIDPKINEEWYSFPDIYKTVIELHARKISPLLWMKTPTGDAERLFVVWW